MKDSLSAEELARVIADLASDRKAYDIVTLAIGEMSSVADYFVIASGRSHIQVSAIAERIELGLKERAGRAASYVEGRENAQWVVLDYGEVVVHVFQESARKLYDLERLWARAPRWNYEDASDKETVRV